MYYTLPVKPGESTTNFLDGMKVNEETGNDYASLVGSIDVQAEAVQAFDGANALMSVWGVSLNVDENGKILSIEE